VKKYCVYRYEKEDTPGFRESFDDLVECFSDEKDAQNKCDALNASEAHSRDHGGWGAGPGTHTVKFHIVEE